MLRTFVAAVAAAPVAIGLATAYGPVVAFASGVAGLAGVVAHEGVHWTVAQLRGYDTVVGWDNVGPFVDYDAPTPDAVVHLAPTALGGGGLLAVGMVAHSPLTLFMTASFFGVMALSPADWADVF